MSKKTTTVDGNEVIVTGQDNRLLISLCGGITGGMVGAVGTYLLIRLMSAMVMKGAKTQQVQQFQNEYR